MLLLVALLATVGMLAWWARWRVRRRRLLALADQLPGPPTLPILGNALMFNVPPEEIFEVLSKLKQKYGRAFRFWLGPDLNYFIGEPKDVKILLQSSKTNSRGTQYQYMTDALGYGILSGSGPVWRQRRKIISAAYGNKAIENYCDIFNKETSFLLDRLKAQSNGQSFNIYTEIVKTTTYTVCETLCGLTREQALSLPHLQDVIDGTHNAYVDLFTRITTWYLQIKPFYWLSSNYQRQKKFTQNILVMGDAIVKHRVKNLDAMLPQNNVNKNFEEDKNDLNVVDRLILSNSIPKYEEMVKQIFAVFTTSQETTANTTSFLLLMMAQHPECQEKLYAEIRSVLGESDRDVTDEDLNQMPYLDMVFKEVIRLFPLGSMVQRTIMEDIDLSNGVTLPAGSSLMVPIYHMHRDKDFWPNPNSFDPEHFSPECLATRHPYCYIPFSLGAMNCLGRHFGTKLVKTISCRVLRQYQLSSPETYADLKLLCAVSVESVNGYPVILHSRHNEFNKNNISITK